MIRVGHILCELRPSGMEKMLAVAAPHWAGHGIACEIVSTGESGPGPFRDTLAAAGYPVFHIPFDRRRPWRHFLAMYRCFRARRWDVLHIQCERALFYYAVLARLARIPACVLTKHNVYPYTGRLQRVRAWQRRIVRALGGRFVAVSPSVRDSEMAKYGNPCLWIRNWIDVDAFAPADDAQRLARRRALGLPAQGPVLIVAGNCSPVKNHNMLLRAMALLKQDNRPCRLLHLGIEGDEGEPERARSLGLAGDCLFAGPVDRVQDYMQAADILVMPSLYEGLGNAALEGLCAGLQAVLTRVPGLRDLATDFDSILYTDLTDPALAAGLRQAIDRLDRPDRAEQAARQHAVARALYGPSAGVAAFARLYAKPRSFSTT